MMAMPPRLSIASIVSDPRRIEKLRMLLHGGLKSFLDIAKLASHLPPGAAGHSTVTHMALAANLKRVIRS